jgi:hypothetical protein
MMLLKPRTISGEDLIISWFFRNLEKNTIELSPAVKSSKSQSKPFKNHRKRPIIRNRLPRNTKQSNEIFRLSPSAEKGCSGPDGNWTQKGAGPKFAKDFSSRLIKKIVRCFQIARIRSPSKLPTLKRESILDPPPIFGSLALK